MAKQTLLKTLLPIASVALIGGGIASTFVLTSCGEKATILNNKAEAISYLQKHKQNTNLQREFNSAHIDSDIAIDNDYFYYLIGDTTPDSRPIYTKQAFVNGLINDIVYEFDTDANFKLKIYNNKLNFYIWDDSNSGEWIWKINYWHSPKDCSISFQQYYDNVPLYDAPIICSNYPNLIPIEVYCTLDYDYSKEITFSYEQMEEPTIPFSVSPFDYETLQVYIAN